MNRTGLWPFQNRSPTLSLAIFDLDNTLIAGDSDHLWGEFLIEQQHVNGVEFARQNDRFYQDYQNGTLDIEAYLAFALAPLTRFSASELTELHRQFMQEKISPLMLDKAADLIEQHRRQGDTLLIITATNRFVTAPIAERLGIANLLASEPEVVDGRYTGKACGIPCFQEGKVKRLQHWLEQEQQSMAMSYFYSDSANDLPLLKQVTHPVAVDPDPRLLQYAKEHNWPIISLRD